MPASYVRKQALPQLLALHVHDRLLLTSAFTEDFERQSSKYFPLPI